MRDVALPAQEHFFSTFGKFMPVAFKHFPSILAEVQNRAADNNVLYLEPMILPDEYASGFLGKKIKWNDNFSVMESALAKQGIDQLAKASAARIVDHKVKAADKMQCEADTAQPGCRVKVGFLYVVFRNQPPTEVFSQLVAAFKTAQQDPTNIVGINMVQAENGLYSLRDYKLHMKMIAFLKKQYPKVHVTLHAGELTKGLVAPEHLKSNIRDAIELGQATRIGHGVSIAHEKDADTLLKKMAKDRVLVEINLTSNKSLLNIEGKNHPLNLYLTYGVPVALSTDDEGVLRTDITQEYMRAVSQHQLSYTHLKTMARNSITHSFLPGESVWRTTYHGFHVVPQCAGNELGAATPAKACSEFLGKNEKAQTQWALERSFAEFERKEWL
jgi:adenosine deaminase